MLPSLRMEFAESFDMKSVENNEETTNIASATETFELQTNEKVECVAHFEVLGNVRQGLCLRGDLFYDIEVSCLLKVFFFFYVEQNSNLDTYL